MRPMKSMRTTTSPQLSSMSRDRVTDQVRLESLEKTLFEDTVSRTLLALYHLTCQCLQIDFSCQPVWRG